MKANDNIQNHDLYLMLSMAFDTLRLKRCEEGDEGFNAFAEENAGKDMNSPFVPDYWFFHYHFSDEQLRLLSETLVFPRSRRNFRDMLPIFQKKHIYQIQIMTLREVCQNIRAEVRADMPAKKNLIDLFTWNKIEDELNLVLSPFQCWKAVNTCQGTLLFSNTPKGNRLLEHYLQY